MEKGNARVMVLIPAYNEEATIYATVQGAHAIPGVSRVLVVDDGSKDQTAEQARRAGAEVLALGMNGGKGQALNRGIGHFQEDVLLLLDGDLGESAKQAEKLLEPIISGQADMTIARFPVSPGKKGFGLVKGLARAGIRLLGGINVVAPLSGQRALTRAVVDNLPSFAVGYGVEVGLTIDLARKGFRIQEVETDLRHQGETGRDLAGFLHRGRQFFHVARVLLQRMVNLSGA